MVEKESQLKIEAESSKEAKEKFGKNVEIHAVFVRHGEKAKTGELTEEGKKQAKEFGEKLEKKTAIKAYTSPVQRVVETVERIVAAAPHDKKLVTRKRMELTIPSISPEVEKKFVEIAKAGGQDAAAEWLLSDENIPETSKTAEALAYVLDRYIRMSDRLYSGSNIDLINGTHQTLPESLLKYVLIRKVEDKMVVGFKDAQEIGGPLKPTESMEYLIKTNEEGNKQVKLNFRDQVYDIDLNKLNELADVYKTKSESESKNK